MSDLQSVQEGTLEYNDPPRLIWVRVRDAVGLLWRDNPKLHDIGSITTSVDVHALQELPKFDANLSNVSGGTGAFKAGNGRIEALEAMERSGDHDLPRGLAREKETGFWVMPIIIGVDAISEAMAKAYALDSNNLTLLGGEFAVWDVAKMWDESYPDLLRLLAEAEALPVSVDGDDLDALLKGLETQGGNDAPEAQVDRAAELQEKWRVQLGQVWQVGRHLLLCGDSTDDISVLGQLPENIIYDPPWNQYGHIDNTNFIRNWKGALGFCDGLHAHRIVELFGAPTWIFTWDCVTSWYIPNQPLRRGKYAIWFGSLEDFNFDGAHYGDSGDERVVENTRGKYTFKPDSRGKHLSDVFQLPITRFHNSGDHKHEKPLDWIRLLIGDCLLGDVFDPFIGAGTVPVACEQLGRQCVGVDVDPKYVALTLQRLCDMGLTPQLVESLPNRP